LSDIGVRCVSAAHFDTANSQVGQDAVRQDAVGQDAIRQVLLSADME